MDNLDLAIGVALTGMTIVFLALVLISTFIAVLPKMLDFVGPYFPETEHHGGPANPLPAMEHAEAADDAAIVAAIGFALHSRRQN